MEAERVEAEAPTSPVAASETPPVAPDPPVQAPQPAPALPAKLSLTADRTVNDAARETIAFGSAALERHRAAAAAGESEPIHQLRVTARRLRASLQLFESVTHAAYTRMIERDLAWMAQAAGGAREREINAEVFRVRASRLDPAFAQSIALMESALTRERSESLKALRKVLKSRRYRRLLQRLENPRLRKVTADEPLGVRAASMLRPIARAAARAGAELDERSTPATIHRLRVRVKRLRYAIEMLSPMGGKRCRKLLARLEGLQELLGDLNDLSVATTWLISFAKSDGTPADAVMAAGAMAQSLRTRSSKLARRSAKAWRKLDKDHAIADAISEIRRNGKQAQLKPVPTPETTTVTAA